MSPHREAHLQSKPRSTTQTDLAIFCASRLVQRVLRSANRVVLDGGCRGEHGHLEGVVPGHFHQGTLDRGRAAAPSLGPVSFRRPDRGHEDNGHAIFGLLLGENMIESYEVYRKPDGDTSTENVIVAFVKLGNRVDGHPGVVHGGILSLIFDDAFGFGTSIYSTTCLLQYCL